MSDQKLLCVGNSNCYWCEEKQMPRFWNSHFNKPTDELTEDELRYIQDFAVVYRLTQPARKD